MSEIRANSITDAAGTGAPDFPNSIELAGSTVTATAAELNVLDGITGIASQAEAEAGTSSTTLMTPQRTLQEINVQTGRAGTWQTQSRSVDTNYQNTTAYPIDVVVKVFSSATVTSYLDAGPNTSSYSEIVGQSMSGGWYTTLYVTVPPGWYYRWRRQSTAASISQWTERRV